MNKLELFVAGCKEGRWRWRSWRSSLFTITALPANTKPELYDIDYKPTGAVFWNGTDWEKVEDHNDFSELYDNRALANFPADSVPNHPEPIQTTYGRMLFNHMVICYAFGTKIPFQHKVGPKDVVKLFVSDVVDGDFQPEEGDTKTYFYPSEVERFVQAMNEVTSLCPNISPTGTDRSLTTDPRVVELRNKLLAEFKDKLTPTNITHIQNELIKMDKQWLKDDDAVDFYLSGKAYNVCRKKMFLMHGIEASFQEGGNFDLIETSLSEGGDLTKITAKNNSIREGSYDRGNDTALGGEKVVFLQRIHQNTRINPGDCGTKLTEPRRLTESDWKNYVGMNIMLNGEVTPLTESLAKASIGKVVFLRRPILCKGDATNFCAACSSLVLSKRPRAIISEIASVASNIMAAYMSSMHGNELAVARYDFRTHIK